MIGRAVTVVVTVALGGFVLAESANAHGLVGKQDLPIPSWLFAWAATAVLVVSFLALGTLWKRPRFENVRGRQLATFPLVVEVAGAVMGVIAFTLLIYAGFAGSQVAVTNILPTTVYVVFWVGIPVVSLFLGDVFRFFNPWRATGAFAGWVARTVLGSRMPTYRVYPEWLGFWPAAAGIASFVWVELIYSGREDPSAMATLALVYAAVQLLGMATFGVSTWTERGDAFAVYFRLFASLSPLAWEQRALRVRTPLSGAAALPMYAGAAVLLCTMIGTTSYDGFSQGPVWQSVAPQLVDAIKTTGLSAGTALTVSQTLMLAATVGVIFGIYRLGVYGVQLSDRRRSANEIARAFAHSLIPIALAYVVAHYVGLVAYQGQAMGYLISDPLGDGSDLFGTASNAIDYGWIRSSGVWYIQVGAIVAGHLAGLALAHDRALSLYPDVRVAVRSQYWMLGVMVGFTSLALWLLSAGA